MSHIKNETIFVSEEFKVVGVMFSNGNRSLSARGAWIEIFKLQANKNEEMQNNISSVEEGEIVICEYDSYDKMKYYAADEFGSNFGYFPKSAEKYIEDKDYKCYITSVEMNENLKTDVEVTFYKHVPNAEFQSVEDEVQNIEKTQPLNRGAK